MARQQDLNVRSSAFDENDTIPRRYTGDGENLSPPLEWSHVPQGTTEIAVIVDDPDAPGSEPFAHWIMYHIPPETTQLTEGVSQRDAMALPAGAVQGKNSFDKSEYGGPAPPKGAPHHYHFAVYALDERLEVGPSANRQSLLDAMEGHVLGKGELVGTYGR